MSINLSNTFCNDYSFNFIKFSNFFKGIELRTFFKERPFRSKISLDIIVFPFLFL